MSSLGDIVTAIETRLTTLAYKATDEVFNFDAVPNSIIDKAYRMETRLIRNEYHLNNQANPNEEISIYIAYKAKRNTRTVWKTALGDRETIEKDIVNAAAIRALASDPLVMMNGEASTMKYLGDYLVSRLVFTIDYLRDITP